MRIITGTRKPARLQYRSEYLFVVIASSFSLSPSPLPLRGEGNFLRVAPMSPQAGGDAERAHGRSGGRLQPSPRGFDGDKRQSTSGLLGGRTPTPQATGPALLFPLTLTLSLQGRGNLSAAAPTSPPPPAPSTPVPKSPTARSPPASPPTSACRTL